MNTDAGETISYEKVDLNSLAAEPIAPGHSEADAERFTQTLDFSWLNRVNEELHMGDDI